MAFISEYQRVEYLESDAKQCIDTGVLATKTTDFEFVGSITENTKTGWIAGAPRIGIHKKAGTVAIIQAPGVHTYMPVGIHEVFTIGLFGDKAYFNGVETNTVVIQNSTKTLFLFAYHHTTDTGSIHTAIRMRSFKIWDNGVLIREYIPCYRKSDNKPGMYDLVTETFFTNAGTGDFVVGPEIITGFATITYNGNVIATISEGQTATLACSQKAAASDIVVPFDLSGSITYNGTETVVEAGKTATLPCKGKKMKSDVVISM